MVEDRDHKAVLAQANLRHSPGLAVSAMTLFGLAMCLPALGSCLQSGPGVVDWMRTRDILLFGPVGPFFMEFGWYANIPFAIEIVALLRRRRITIWLVPVHLVLVLSSLVPVEVLGPGEAAAVMCRWGPGYWLWFTAQAIAVIGAVLKPLAERTRKL